MEIRVAGLTRRTAAGNNPVAHFTLLQHHLWCEKTHASTGPYFVAPSAVRVKAEQHGFTALCTE